MSADRRELLDRYGRVYGGLGLAIAFTRGIEGEAAKKPGTGCGTCAAHSTPPSGGRAWTAPRRGSRGTASATASGRT